MTRNYTLTETICNEIETIYERQIEFEGQDEDFRSFLTVWSLIAASADSYHLQQDSYENGGIKELVLTGEDGEFKTKRTLVVEVF